MRSINIMIITTTTTIIIKVIIVIMTIIIIPSSGQWKWDSYAWTHSLRRGTLTLTGGSASLVLNFSFKESSLLSYRYCPSSWSSWFPEFSHILAPEYMPSRAICRLGGKSFDDGAETRVECNGWSVQNYHDVVYFFWYFWIQFVLFVTPLPFLELVGTFLVVSLLVDIFWILLFW